MCLAEKELQDKTWDEGGQAVAKPNRRGRREEGRTGGAPHLQPEVRTGVMLGSIGASASLTQAPPASKTETNN